MWTTETRRVYERPGLRYPSDLTDEEWALVEPLIPPAKRGGRQRTVDVREVLNGVFYVLMVIRGTRIPVHDVAAAVAAGRSLEQILETWPSLDARTVGLATLYAEANPLRGRPRMSGALPEGSTIITDRRIARRRTAG